MRYAALCLVALAGCSAPALAIDGTVQPLAVCYSTPGQLLAVTAKCPGRTADGLDCHVCRDYAGCVVGRGEAADYCTDARYDCQDPACAY